MMTSNFELKPLKLTVFEATTADWAELTEPPRRKNQRSPADFKVKAIKADRELRHDSSYRPEFTNVPLLVTEVEVALTADEAAALDRLRATGKYGETDAEVLRYVFFTWWIENFMQGPKHARSG
jgi:uncharacterized protein